MPDEKLVRQAELRWRVTERRAGRGDRDDGGRRTAAHGAGREARDPRVLRGARARARDWAVERCAGGKASAAGVRAVREELGAAVERAAGGTEVLFAGVDWTLAAAPPCSRGSSRCSGHMVSVLAFVGAAVWGGRRVIRLVMA